MGQLRDLSRNTIGVKATTLNEGDEIISFGSVEDNEFLTAVSENDYGKKTELSDYAIQNRGGKDTRTYKIAKEAGDVACAKVLRKDDEVLLISKQTKTTRVKAEGISTSSRNMSGALLKNTDKGEDAVVTAVRYFEE